MFTMDDFNEMNNTFKKEKDSLDKDLKLGKKLENINDFAKELANIHGYESFDDMTDDEKYMALTLWRDHITK